MTIVVPVAVAAPPLPLPDPADSATFSARKLSDMDWARNTLVGGVLALADASHSNATDAQGSATSANAQAVSAAASASSAASTAGVTKWITGTNYAQGANTWSPITYLTYRCKVAGVSSTDPSADPTNWQLLLPGLTPVIVSGATQAATPGNRYVLTNVAATTLTLPATPSNGDMVAVIVGNALTTNIVARNGSTIMGLAEDLTLDSTTQPVTLQYLNSSWRFI